MHKQSLKILFASIALVAMVAAAGCTDADSEAKVENPVKSVKVLTKMVEPVTLNDYLSLPGETEPDADVCISSESAGIVTWVGAEEGDRVERGSVIVRLDVSSSGARFDKAKAAKKLASEQLRRRQELLKKGVLAQEEFDRMESELAQSEASLKEMQVSVGYGIAVSPISGIVNKRYVDRGERLNVGDKVADIVDPSIIRTTVNVPEMDIPYIKKGQEVAVTVDAIPGRSWKGVVEFVSFKADRSSKTFKVRVLTDNPDGVIRAGMLARVSLLRRSLEGAITAPLFSLINQGGERLVYVEEDGVARARTVTIGVIEKDRVQILEGLKAGDNLIVAGHNMVEDGTRVAVQ